jgi:hypothetical protein
LFEFQRNSRSTSKMALSQERSTLLYMLVALYATFFMWYAGWPRNGVALEEVEAEVSTRLHFCSTTQTPRVFW